jgi:hypothetical protein
MFKLSIISILSPLLGLFHQNARCGSRVFSPLFLGKGRLPQGGYDEASVEKSSVSISEGFARAGFR